jgi:hypothetical protein
MTDLQVLGDPIDERKVVFEFLCTVPKPYKEMAKAIESLLDLKNMTLEELTGRLIVCEDHIITKKVFFVTALPSLDPYMADIH